MATEFYSQGIGRKYLSFKLGFIFHPTSEDTSNRNYDVKETQDSKGNVYQNAGMWFSGMKTLIHGIRFHDTQYGTNINIELGDNYILSDKVDSRTGTMLMDLLPSLDLSKEVYIMPYDFIGNDKKRVRGVMMKQDDVKVEPFFFNKEAKAYPKDFPKVPAAPKNGKVSPQAWILYFGNIAMALKERVEEWAQTASFPQKEDVGDDAYSSHDGAYPEESDGAEVDAAKVASKEDEVDDLPF